MRNKQTFLAIGSIKVNGKFKTVAVIRRYRPSKLIDGAYNIETFRAWVYRKFSINPSNLYVLLYSKSGTKYFCDVATSYAEKVLK